MLVGGYTLHLYCDYNCEIANSSQCDSIQRDYLDKVQTEFAGHNKTNCIRQAKKKGWLFRPSGKILCKHHNGEWSKKQ